MLLLPLASQSMLPHTHNRPAPLRTRQWDERVNGEVDNSVPLCTYLRWTCPCWCRCSFCTPNTWGRHSRLPRCTPGAPAAWSSGRRMPETSLFISVEFTWCFFCLQCRVGERNKKPGWSHLHNKAWAVKHFGVHEAVWNFWSLCCWGIGVVIYLSVIGCLQSLDALVLSS